MNITQWIKYGVEKGYCTQSYCSTHDGEPTTEAEDESWDEGADPCAYCVRLIESPEMKIELEKNSSGTWMTRKLFS